LIEAGRRRTRKEDGAVATIGEGNHGRLSEQLPGKYQRKNDEKKTHGIAATADSFPDHCGNGISVRETGKRPPTRVALPGSLSPRQSRVLPAAVRTDMNAGLQTLRFCSQAHLEPVGLSAQIADT
jgi:hypothetical protein